MALASEVADYILNTTVTALDAQGVPHLFTANATLKVEMPPGHVCGDPPQSPGQGHGKGKAKGKVVKCEKPHALSKADPRNKPCPPGWLKHGDGVACVHPGGNGGNGNGNGQGNGGGGGNGQGNNGNGNGNGGGG